MSAFDELAKADVDLLTTIETVPRSVLEEALRIADRYGAALRQILDAGETCAVEIAERVLNDWEPR